MQVQTCVPDHVARSGRGQGRRAFRAPWHCGAVPRGCPLRIPRDRAATVGNGRGARRRAPAGPPLLTIVARSVLGTPQFRGNPTCGEADRRRGGATHGPRAWRRPWRAARSSAAGIVRGAPDRAPQRCGLRAAFGSRLPALPSLAATPRCQGFRSALDTARAPAAALASAGAATVAPDGRDTALRCGRPRGVQRCGLRAAISGGLARVHHR